MKKILKKLLGLFNRRKYDLDKEIRKFADIEYKNDSDFAYYWLKNNPNKTLSYRDRY